MRPPQFRAHELADHLAFAHARAELSAAAGVPLVVVDLGGPIRLPPARRAELITALRELAAVTVAVRPDPHDVAVDDLADACDLVVPGDDDAALDEVIDAVFRTPLAAATLALLLRHGEGRSTEAGLIAESTAYSTLQAGPDFTAWRASRPVRSRPPEIGPAVLLDRQDGTLRITLARPHVHNAFSARLRDGLVTALETALADDTITEVVVDGAGPSFCSGGDLDEFGSFGDPTEAHLVRMVRHAGRLIERLGDRIVVRLHGAAMGAGIELPAFAGRVVADPGTSISLPELALGLVPGAGGTVSIPRRIGRQRTAWLAVTGRSIDAATALAWGLVDAVEAHRPDRDA